MCQLANIQASEMKKSGQQQFAVGKQVYSMLICRPGKMIGRQSAFAELYLPA
jgi:hypothetical protein